mgnify:CR=1 FL=1
MASPCTWRVTRGFCTAPNAAPVPGVPGEVPSATVAAPTQGLVTVTTNVLRLQVDPRGASLVGADLLAYPVDKDKPDVVVRLLGTDALHFSVAQSGLVANSGTAPSHEAMFRTEDGRSNYTLADGSQELEVPLVWEDPATGLRVRKVLVLERGSYAITVRQEITNQGSQAWRGAASTRSVPAGGGLSRSTAGRRSNSQSAHRSGARGRTPRV